MVHIGPPSRAKRHRLPDERASITHHFYIGDEEGYFTVGMYPDGRMGEIFVSFAEAGSSQRGLLDAWAAMISLALQSGVSLEAIVEKFKHWKFEPAGVTRNTNIPMCSSPLDYICKWLELKFLTNTEDNSDEKS